jgi:hypothetical protein
MTGRILSRARHELQWGEPRIRWGRWMAFAVAALAIVGRVA